MYFDLWQTSRPCWRRAPRWMAAATLCGVLETAAASSFDEGVQAYERQDYVRAIAMLTPPAEAGNADAQDLLGASYEEGKGDFVMAAQWYQRAAAAGQSDAMTRLGELYEDGDGVPQDTQTAMSWLEKAAAMQDVDAETDLGELWSDVLGDNGQAAQWFNKAAEAGDVQAQYRLGLLLLGGEDVARDLARAWVYLSLAGHDIDDAAQSRDVLELEMTPQELQHARSLLADWQKSHGLKVPPASPSAKH